MKRIALLVMVLTGCPPHETKPEAGAPGCKSVGQSCEFSPGKLGTCVSKDPCAGGDCLVCQSQH